MKTLIVDDDILNCKLLQGLLSSYSDCKIAMDGESAVEFFKKANEKGEPFDLVCLDIMMPEVSGFEVLRKIRKYEEDQKLAKKSKIVMISAYGEQRNKAETFYEGCDGFLVKPVEKNIFFEMLRKLGLPVQ